MKLDTSKFKVGSRGLCPGLLFAFILLVSASSTFGQGNSISGHVFGLERRPVPDVDVELLDEFSRTLQRMKTNSSGGFFFYRLAAGRYKVRVLPFATEYEEQEQEVEIVNFIRGTGSGDDRTYGTANEQKDIYLRLRRGASPTGPTSSVFLQEVPPDAKKLYEHAVDELKSNKTKEAYEALKSSLEIFPKYFAALELLASEYLKAGHYEASQILFTLANQVNPRSFSCWHGLAYSLYSQKKYAEAITAIDKAIEVNGSVPDGLLLHGVLLRRTQKLAEAEKELTKAKELYGEVRPEIRRELGLVYSDQKKYKEAAKELRAYVKARPDAKDTAAVKTMLSDIEAKVQ
jgi:tetratricopeptide (TPR) repeat protein